MPTDRLREILRRRAFHIRSVPRVTCRRDLCVWMSQALSDAYSVRRTFEETDVLQGRVLAYVVSQGGELSHDAIREAFSTIPPDLLDQAASGLEELGLAVRVYISGGMVLWTPDAVQLNVPLPLPLRHKLQSALEGYDDASLSHICRFLSITGGGHRKASKAEAIATAVLSQPTAELRERLSDDANTLLDYVIRLGGVTNLHELGLQLDTRRRNQLYSYDWSYRWHSSTPRNPVEELLSAAFLVMEGSVGFHYGTILIAGDLFEKLLGRGLLTGGIPSPPGWGMVSAEGEPIRAHDTLTRDVAAFLAYLDRNKTGRTGKGIIHRTALKNCAKMLSLPSAPYASFVYAVCREAGLIEPAPRTSDYELAPDGEAWLEAPRGEQQRTLYEAWKRQTTWCEPAPDMLVDDGVYVDRDEIRAIRTTILELLKDAAGQFPRDLAPLESLTAMAWYRRWASFPRTAGSPDSEALEDETTVGSSEVVSRVTIALYWLGLLEGVTQTDGALRAVRLTQAGRSMLLGEPLCDPIEDLSTFVVQPNLEIYAPPNLRSGHFFRLSLMSDTSASGMLVLTRDSLRKAMDSGRSTEDILEFLRSHSSTGLPQNVEYLIREVGGKHGHIRIGTAGLYLVVDDPIMLKELDAQKKLNLRVRRRLSDTVALITGDSVESVLKHLRQAGYSPVLDRDELPKPVLTRRTGRGSTKQESEPGAGIIAAIDWDVIDPPTRSRRT